MYLLRNSNFNFSNALHIISIIFGLYSWYQVKERNINTIIEIQNSLFSVKAGASLLKFRKIFYNHK